MHLVNNRPAKSDKREFLNGIQVMSHRQLLQTSHSLSVSFVLTYQQEDPRLNFPDMIGSDI